jgi:signal transduction histidine kinase
MSEREVAELRAARRRIIEAGDAMRGQLAQELHDGAQQQLVSCIISLQLAQQKWECDPVKARQFLDSSLEQAQAGLSALRGLVADIHPPILGHLGLRPAVEALAARLPIPVTLELTDEQLPAPVAASVYFILTEALVGAVENARASRAAIRIAIEQSHLIVQARDDGRGSRHASMPSITDRVAALDGELTITSAPSNGTTLRAEIPLPPRP